MQSDLKYCQSTNSFGAEPLKKDVGASEVFQMALAVTASGTPFVISVSESSQGEERGHRFVHRDKYSVPGSGNKFIGVRARASTLCEY